MYCNNEVFTQAIDFSESQAGWKMFSDTLIKGTEAEKEHLIETIKCATTIMKDPQIENLLELN